MLCVKPHVPRPSDTSSPTTPSSDRKRFENSALMHTESFERLPNRDDDVHAWFRTWAEAIDGVPSRFIRDREEMGHEGYGHPALFTITRDLHLSYLTTVPRTSVQRSQELQMRTNRTFVDSSAFVPTNLAKSLSKNTGRVQDRNTFRRTKRPWIWKVT
jgi:hypothetical protein